MKVPRGLVIVFDNSFSNAEVIGVIEDINKSWVGDLSEDFNEDFVSV